MKILGLKMRDWRQWIFRDLPLSHIVRIVDCFLVEGHKFLLRTAIAIVYMWSKIEKVSLPNISFTSTCREFEETIKLEVKCEA